MELFLEREVPSLFECGKEEQGDVGVLSLVCNRGEGGDEYAPALFPLGKNLGTRLIVSYYTNFPTCILICMDLLPQYFQHNTLGLGIRTQAQFT